MSAGAAVSARVGGVSGRLEALAATVGFDADSAQKAIALEWLQQRVWESARTREQSALLCTQLVHGDIGRPSLAVTFRRWVQADTHAALRGALLDVLLSLLSTTNTRDALTSAHCQTLMALAMYAIRAERLSRTREKGFQLMDALLQRRRMQWDGNTNSTADRVTPVDIIDAYVQHRAHAHAQAQAPHTLTRGAPVAHRLRSLTRSLPIAGFDLCWWLSVRCARGGVSLFRELGGKKSALTAKVTGLLYSALGGLCNRFPSALQSYAPRVAETLCRALQSELHSSKEPSVPQLVGAMRGLTDFLHSFSAELTKRQPPIDTHSHSASTVPRSSPPLLPD